MTVDKRISYDVQGGVKNYLGKQKEVTAPVKWKSSPDSPETELAYITKAEKDLLVKKDLHGSLKGGVNRGPSGIMSLDGFGSIDESQNVSGSQVSAAETGSRGSGMSDDDRRDFRSAAIAAGAGQRVNPGFFDDRNTVSKAELARAKAFNPAAFRAGRRGGIMDFFTGGGFLGNIVRNLGQRFGLGKKYNAPYDRPQFAPGFAANTMTMGNDIYNEFLNEEEDGAKRFTDTGRLTDPNAQALYDLDRNIYLNEQIAKSFTPNQINRMFNPLGQMDNTGINFYNDNAVPLDPNLNIFKVKDLRADASTFPTDDGSGISLMNRSILRNAGYNDSQIKEAQEDGYLDQLIRDIEGPIGGSAFG